MKATAFDHACPEALDEAPALLTDAKHESEISSGGQRRMPSFVVRLDRS